MVTSAKPTRRPHSRRRPRLSRPPASCYLASPKCGSASPTRHDPPALVVHGPAIAAPGSRRHVAAGDCAHVRVPPHVGPGVASLIYVCYSGCLFTPIFAGCRRPLLGLDDCGLARYYERRDISPVVRPELPVRAGPSIALVLPKGTISAQWSLYTARGGLARTQSSLISRRDNSARSPARPPRRGRPQSMAARRFGLARRYILP